MTKNGIDVASWQSNVDWPKVKAAGIDFAMIRVGWCYNNGALKEDTRYRSHISGALAAGLAVGVYLYSYATTAEAARRAAKEVIEAVKPYKLSYPIASTSSMRASTPAAANRLTPISARPSSTRSRRQVTTRCSIARRTVWTAIFTRLS